MKMSKSENLSLNTMKFKLVAASVFIFAFPIKCRLSHNYDFLQRAPA